jgi:hypothetical protein
MGVKAREINVSYRLKIAITKLKVEAGRLRGCASLTEASAPVVADHLGDWASIGSGSSAGEHETFRTLCGY